MCPFQQEAETFLVSGLARLVEIMTSGVERFADVIADDRDFAIDAFEVLPLLH